jgi:lipoprotein-releasing system permease protein
MLGASLALFTPMVLASWLVAILVPGALSLLSTMAKGLPWLGAALAAPSVVYALAGLALAKIAGAEPRGKGGRARRMVLGCAAAVAGVAGAVVASIMPARLAPLPKLVLATAAEVWLSLSRETQTLLSVAGVLAAGGFLVALGASIGLWFLLGQRVRNVIFSIVDITAFAFAGYAWLTFLRTGRADNDAARLLLTFLVFVRVFVRTLPVVLDSIERIGFQSLVAARLLRAKKSGFLAAIAGLSILAVSVSSCALTTTLSVMGGFRQDLKRKILGNTAHIVLDRPGDEAFDGYAAVARSARLLSEVRGVSPYVSGEVMISSSSNLAGAVLRGIDPAHIGDVSELPQNIEKTGIGSLDYLLHPEKLTRLSVTQLSLGVGGPKIAKFTRDEDAPVGAKGRLLDELDKMLAGVEAPSEANEKVSDSPASDTTLPGVIVGRELARSLRLYLGDEVNVVTPLGDLGPTGPMPKARPFRVAGIFYSGMYEYDMKLAYVTLPSAQRFFGLGDKASGIEITVREPERAQEVAAELARVSGAQSLRVRPWQELNKNLFGALALEKLAMFIALGIAILVASFCIVGTLTLMVQEKGREVAVLKAMGAADRAIVGVFVLEGTLIGLFGSLIGLALGYVVCFGAERFGVRLNPEVYYIDRLPVHIDPAEFLAVGLSAVAVCFVVTIYPALLASRLRPVDALRYE